VPAKTAVALVRSRGWPLAACDTEGVRFGVVVSGARMGNGCGEGVRFARRHGGRRDGVRGGGGCAACAG